MPVAERARWGTAVALLLVAAFLLRVWGIKQGLPYAYNADENAHFVPKAIGLFDHGWNPHYFVNPPAYTYVLHFVFDVWFGGRAGVSASFAKDPTDVFLVARVVSAAFGTLAVWFLYLAGAKLFADGIRIIDDPLRKRGLRSHPFDGEGVAGQKLALVEDGVLRSWLLDSATARELGLVTTGHALRSASSVPSPSPSNLHLEPGRLTPNALIADIADGFYITDLIGMGANMVTGDYSRGASGFWIEHGELTYPVSEVTIAGHLNDIFRSLTPANDLAFRYGFNAPTIRIEGLTVAGV